MIEAKGATRTVDARSATLAMGPTKAPSSVSPDAESRTWVIEDENKGAEPR